MVATGAPVSRVSTTVYDAEGNEYPVDEDGNLTLDFIDEEDAAASQQNQQNSEN